MARKLPAHSPGSVRAWRVKKRRELQAVCKAVDRRAEATKGKVA
jgi:hypothetical protein